MDDAELPGAADLLAPQARTLLAPAVRAGNGQVLRARPTQVRYDPSRRLAVRYAAQVRWPAGERTETLGALMDPAGLPPSLAVVHNGRTTVGVWRYPHDPYLPGLPHAAYPHGVRQVLRAMNLPADGAEITPVVYRPCRRAVLRVRMRDRLLYLKVVPPSETAALRATHETFGRHTPVARCLAWADELGLLVLEALPDRPMKRVLVDGGILPAPGAIADLLRGVRAVDLPAGQREPIGTVAWYARLLRQTVPEAAPLVDDLAAAAGGPAAGTDTTTHGDLHPGQLLIHDSAVSGLLDLDAARPGSAADDPATLLAHLVALAHVRPAAASRITDYRHQLQAQLTLDVEPEVLVPAVTGVLLGLATTPFRRQEPDWRRRTMEWLDLVRGWAHA